MPNSARLADYEAAAKVRVQSEASTTASNPPRRAHGYERVQIALSPHLRHHLQASDQTLGLHEQFNQYL